MNVYGNACPMCCGDVDDVAYLRTGEAVCRSCGYNAKPSASMPFTTRRPDAMAFGLSGTAMSNRAMARAPISLSRLIQNQTAGASMARTEQTTHLNPLNPPGWGWRIPPSSSPSPAGLKNSQERT